MKYLAILLCLIGCEKVYEPGFAHDWKWKTPINIAMKVDVGWDKYMKSAIGKWHDAVGCDIFNIVDHTAPADVLVVHGGSHETMKGGAWVNIVSGSPAHGEIRMFNVGTGNEAFSVLLHELGMILGLDGNDPQPWSVMNRNVVERDSMYIRITDKDRAAVRDRYCR